MENDNPFTSQNSTTDLVDQVVADHDVDILKMKEDVQEMWKKCSSKRERRSVASEKTPGFSLYGDNIGKFNLCYVWSTHILFEIKKK
jgi:hypothetical protein